MGSPPLPMLRFLQTVLPDMRIDQAYYDFLVEFLPAFCSCVPSNVIDETFSVLNILISLLNNNMTEDLIICIINALLD